MLPSVIYTDAMYIASTNYIQIYNNICMYIYAMISYLQISSDKLSIR